MTTRGSYGLVVLAVLTCTTGCNERHDYVFADLREAVDHGSIERGWIPSSLPADSRDIWLTYDLDTNVTLIKLVSESWAESVIANGIVVEPIGHRQVRFTGMRAVDWWPEEFLENVGESFFRFPDEALASEAFGVPIIYGATRGDTVYLWRAADR